MRAAAIRNKGIIMAGVLLSFISAFLLVFPQQALSQPGSLVAAYAFDEGSGTTVADASGNAQNGTITGATWTSSGKYGYALSFNGSNSRVSIADSSLLDLTIGMTLEAWVYPSAAPNNWKSIIIKEAPGFYVYALYISPLRHPAGIIVINGQEQGFEGSATLALNAWTHLAVTYDGTVIRLYVNGTQAGSQSVSGSITTSTGYLRIGGNSVWGGEYFNGRIDDVRIYNRSLTAAEIQSDLSAPVGYPSAPTLSALTLSPSSVVGGDGVTGTVTLSAAAPAGGAVVSLSSSNASVAAVPGSVTVPAGGTSAGFAVSTSVVTGTTSVTISGSYGGVVKSSSLVVNPAPVPVTLSSVSVSPSSVVGGDGVTGTVTLSAAAPAGGAVVSLSSSNASVAAVPGSVTVPAGGTSAGFAVSTSVVTGTTSVIISASYGGTMVAASLNVLPQQPTALPPEPVVAIHVSELTQALESMPAKPPTPVDDPEASGYEWFYTSWHYFVAYESLKEALRSDGTPFVEVTDADIASGRLLYPDGSPRYPILISLASEAIADSEIAPLVSYVDAGGFLFVGSSAFTRNPDGTTRGEFALADEMGIHMANPSLWNWGLNMGFAKVADHRLVSQIPQGELNWRMPQTSEEIPIGVSPTHTIHGEHFVWQVTVSDANLIAYGYLGPMLAVKKYGKGNFIYHGAMQPLIGHGGFDSSMYAYLIYKNAIEWAFESANLPVIRLSPWQYPYDAAFVVRHDFENYQDLIRSIETSAAYEHSLSVGGDYYFCTGTLREEMADKAAAIAALRRAVSNYGATIGSHNGGLKNPVNLSLPRSAYDYWHWGPDEALDVTPVGYANGKAYAESSISISFEDIENWLTGLDNGRSGCGAANDCPRIWVSPAFNSTREDSYRLLEQLGTVTAGEQKIGPYPHWTVSTQTAGKRYEQVTLPVSEWYAGSDVLQTLDDHSMSTMRAAVDFYYGLGALINLYGHNLSQAGTVQGEYVAYCAAKPRVWATNSVKVYDWWKLRSGVTVTPDYYESGDMGVAVATIEGASDVDTAVEIAIPGLNGTDGLQVFLNGSPADPNDYRASPRGGVKIRVGATAHAVEVHYPKTVQNEPAELSSLSVSPTTVRGGNSSTGTVTLSGPAPSGGAVVSLSSSNRSVAAVPASVTVASGNSSATFTITTRRVYWSTSVTISSTYAGVRKTASVTVTR
jgi:hypothetical protein